MSQGEEEEGGGNEVHLGLPCGRQKVPKIHLTTARETPLFTLSRSQRGGKYKSK